MDMSIIRDYVNKVMNERNSLAITYGVVVSIDPLQIKLNKNTILDKNHL